MTEAPSSNQRNTGKLGAPGYEFSSTVILGYLGAIENMTNQTLHTNLQIQENSVDIFSAEDASIFDWCVKFLEKEGEYIEEIINKKMC